MSDLEYEDGDINKVDGPVEEDEVDEEEYVEGDINKVGSDGGIAEKTLRYLLDSVVDDKDAVFIDVEQGRGKDVTFDVHVSPDDVGKIIGRKGRVIQATRTLVKAAGMTEGVSARVEVDD